MRLVAFTDFHASVVHLKKVREKIRKFKPDVAVCCGDISVFEQNIGAVMKQLGSLSCRLLLIHGNHEEASVVAELAKKYPNIVFLHKRTFLLGEVLFVGYGGQGFVRRDQEFERFIKSIDGKLRAAKKVVLVTHQPPYGTKLDLLWEEYVGNESFSKAMKKYKSVVLGLSGHIHETFGVRDKVGGAVVLNPGPEGMVVEL